MAEAAGASVIYAKIGNLEGEVEEAEHKGWITLKTFKFEFEQPATWLGGNKKKATHERAIHNPVTCEKQTDKASASLMKLCWSGEKIDTVIIEAYRSIGGTQDKLNYVRWELEDVLVTKFEHDFQNNELPKEEVELTYLKVKFKYSYSDKKTGQYSGQTAAGHDLLSNVIS